MVTYIPPVHLTKQQPYGNLPSPTASHKTAAFYGHLPSPSHKTLALYGHLPSIAASQKTAVLWSLTLPH